LLKIFERRVKLFNEIRENQAPSEKQAKAMMAEHFDIEVKKLKIKQELVEQLSKKLSQRKVAKYFQLEGKIEGGFFCEIARQLPLIE